MSAPSHRATMRAKAPAARRMPSRERPRGAPCPSVLDPHGALRLKADLVEHRRRSARRRPDGSRRRPARGSSSSAGTSRPRACSTSHGHGIVAFRGVEHLHAGHDEQLLEHRTRRSARTASSTGAAPRTRTAASWLLFTSLWPRGRPPSALVTASRAPRAQAEGRERLLAAIGRQGGHACRGAIGPPGQLHVGGAPFELGAWARGSAPTPRRP